MTLPDAPADTRYDTAAALLRMVLEVPFEDAPRLVLADHLEERGDCRAAGEQRLLVQLKSVLADPFGDAPRLEYARVCDLHQQPERAEFIRVQCELATLIERVMPNGVVNYRVGAERRAGHLEGRSRGLLERHWSDWAGPILARWHCDDLWTPKPTPTPCFSFRRGFVDHVTLPLAALEALAGRLAAAPLTAVRVTDREPLRWVPDSGGSHQRPARFSWVNGDFERHGESIRERATLPGDLFRELTRLPDAEVRFDEYARYDSPELAHAALSRVLVQLCRESAGLPTPGPEPSPAPPARRP